MFAEHEHRDGFASKSIFLSYSHLALARWLNILRDVLETVAWIRALDHLAEAMCD